MDHTTVRNTHSKRATITQNTSINNENNIVRVKIVKKKKKKTISRTTYKYLRNNKQVNTKTTLKFHTCKNQISVPMLTGELYKSA
jgi:hypothetical protein